MEEKLLERLKRGAPLPSPPGTAMRVLQICQQGEVPIAELADTIAADPALSLRILRYANSPLVGMSRPVTSVREAVLLLGARSVRLMALNFSLITSDDARTCPGFDYGHFWCHCSACGIAARHLAKRTRDVSPEEAFTAGMLVYVGKLAFAACLPDEYSQILHQAGGVLGPTDSLEQQCFGMTSCELSAELITDWGIPPRLAEVVRHHRDPSTVEDPTLQRFARLVVTAAQMAVLIQPETPGATRDGLWDSIVASEFFEDRPQAEEMLEAIRAEFAELTAVLGLHEGISGDVGEIRRKTSSALASLSLATALKDVPSVPPCSQAADHLSDPVTGLPSRIAFDAELAQQWLHATREGQPIALTLIDVDHLQRVNDQDGYETGNTVLAAVAECLASAVRPADILTRMGDDEFAVIMPTVDRLIAAQVCVRIRKAIEGRVFTLQSGRRQVTVSLGTAIIASPDPSCSSQTLIDAATAQLARAKSLGGNRCSMRQLPSRAGGSSQLYRTFMSSTAQSR